MFKVQALCIFNSICSTLDTLLTGDHKLMLQMDVAGSKKSVNAVQRSIFDGGEGAMDIHLWRHK